MSVLPTKYVPIDSSILGVASILLGDLGSNDTVSSLWDRVRTMPQVRTFDRYAEALTLLFAARIVDLRRGILVQTREAGASQ
ncbi:hypothetical protein IVB22_10870 [Bradyrhizobium sp. 190]|uniref:ABC-three component system middle component 6 n=1 Tax=Bradyrhizobium sp. 190 TaxID=2782658 RepID=UPI001FF899F8|nr:ABC-three component system middle component 6 [Bradyrhizobium sp. 190]MCK1513066.1 hypothetical protein [Bradyrhizobium sp. 190]